MADERMSSKQYAKYEKIFYLFGSVSKMVTPVRPDEWEKLAEDLWQWAIVRVNQLVEEYTEISEAPPPSVESPPLEPPPETKPEVAYITQPQAKRFYALAHNAGKNDDQIKSYLATYGIASGYKIPKADYERLCTLVQQ